MKLLLLGGPGVGKSYLVSQLRVITQNTEIKNVSCAYTGCAASVLDHARTTSSLFDLMKPRSTADFSGESRTVNPDVLIAPLTPDHLERMRGRLGGAHVVIVDEVSMIGAALLGKLHSRLCQVALTEDDRSLDFGGHCMVMVGDFYQIPPVGDHCLVNAVMDTLVYETREATQRSPGNPSATGTRLFVKFDLAQLVTQVRAASDSRHAQFLAHMRGVKLGEQAVPNELIDQLLRQKLSYADTVADRALLASELHRAWALAPVLVATNAEREHMIERQCIRAAKLLGVPVVKWRLGFRTSWYNKEELDVLYSGTPGAWAYFVQGAPAFVTENQNPLKGVANGTRVVMHSLVFGAGAPSSEGDVGVGSTPVQTVVDQVLARIGDAAPGEVVDLGALRPTYINVGIPTADATRWPKEETLVQGEVVVPLGPSRYSRLTVDLPKVGRFYVPQKRVRLEHVHALECGFALTFHKVQGKTLPKVVLELAERPFKTGKGNLDFNGLLVALSRVASTNDLRIVAAPDDQFDYLRHLRAPQSLLLWLEGFADGKGLWDIDRCRTAVERAIIDGIFVDAVRSKKVNQPYLAKLIRQAADRAKSTKKKGRTTTDVANKVARKQTESAEHANLKKSAQMTAVAPPLVLPPVVGISRPLKRKHNCDSVTDLKKTAQMTAVAPPLVLPPVVDISRSLKRKHNCDSVTNGTTSAPVGRTDPGNYPAPAVSVPRPPLRPLAVPFPGYSLTQTQSADAAAFLVQCVLRSRQDLTVADRARFGITDFRGTDSVFPSVFSTIFHSSLRGPFCVDNLAVATLNATKWLDGDVISSFLYLQVLQRALQPGTDRAHRVTIFDSYFFRNLRVGLRDPAFKADRMVTWMSGRTVKKQLTLDEAFSGDILFPLHHAENHWLLVIIPRLTTVPGRYATSPRVVYVLDPYGRGIAHVSHFRLIAAWLQCACPDDVRPVTPIYEVREIPRQRDMFSCGVYVSMFAYHWIWCGTLPTPEDFDDRKAAAFRLFMAHTIRDASRGGLEQAMKAYINPVTGQPVDLYTPCAGDVARLPALPRHLHVVLCTKAEGWGTVHPVGRVLGRIVVD